MAGTCCGRRGGQPQLSSFGQRRGAASWAWCWAFVAALPSCASAGGQAVLRLEDGSKTRSVPALLAEWSDLEGSVDSAPVIHWESDPFGCEKQRKCADCALFVQQGKCAFAQKAWRAEEAGAQLLIVASTADGPLGMASVLGAKHPIIPAVMVSKAAGQQVLDALNRGDPLLATCFRYDRLFDDLFGEFVILALAVGLVVWGAWHSVEDLRRPELRHQFNEEVVAVEDGSGPQFVIFGSLMLTVLFFFMKYLIYVLLFLFATGAISTTAMLLEPVIASWCPPLRRHKALSLPKFIADTLGLPRDHSWADLLAEGVGCALAVAFLMYRNYDAFGWVLQDTIAVMLLLTIQRTMRVPNLKVATLLLISTFFFDIFWVFLSPLIFKKSVMIEVATGGGTGQSVPMVLKIPPLVGEFAGTGNFKILGLGDIAIPGLLLSMLLRHDLLRQSRMFKGYFAAGVLGYAIGLVCTFLSLYIMNHGQPALLYLVPGTLAPTFLIALRERELDYFWSASYVPEQPPVGYAALPDEEDKRA